jgi:hypothetical protein
MSWRRIVLLSLALVAVIGTITALVLQRTDAATTLLRNELQALLRPKASLAGSSIDVGRGRLTLQGLRVEDPLRAGSNLLACETIHVDVGTVLALPPVAVSHIAIDGFTIDLGPGLVDLPRLLAPQAPSRTTGPTTLPRLHLRGGLVRCVPRAGVEALELRDVEVTAAADGHGTLAVQGSARWAEFDTTLRVAGAFDLHRGGGRLTLTAGELTIGDALLGRIQQLLGRAPAALSVDALLRTLTLVVTLPADDAVETLPSIELALQCTQLRVRGPEVPAVVVDATLDLHADSRNDGAVTARLVQSGPDGKLTVSAQATAILQTMQLDVRADGENLAVTPEALRALRTFRVGRDVVAALQPTSGRADLRLFLRDPQLPGGISELDLSLRDVAMSYHGFGSGPDRPAFPLPMVGASGAVHLRDDIVQVTGVSANIASSAGGGTVTLEGRIEPLAPSGEDTALDIHARGVTFNADLRAALTELLDDNGELYDKFAPVGRTDVTVLVRPGKLLPGGWSVEVRPDAASMQWAGFPYRLDDLRGTVRVDDADVRFDLSGRHGDGQLSMRGHIPLGEAPADTAGFAATIELRGVTIDDDLRTAAAVIVPELDAPWRDSNARGRFDGQVKVWRPNPGDPLHHDARLELTGVDLELAAAAPWRATGLHGQLLVQGSGGDARVDFDALRGSLEHPTGTPAQLAMLGHLAFGSSERSDLAFVVRDLELDPQLGQSLAALGALGPGAWDTLRPSGQVDLVCHYDAVAGRPDDLSLVVQLLGVTSEAPILPRPAKQMRGELHVVAGELRFRDVTAELGDATVRCTGGRVRTLTEGGPRTEISFGVTARGVPVDDGIANLFSGPLRQAVLDRHLDGRADLDDLQLRFVVPSQGCTLPFETTIGGQLRLRGLDMRLGEGKDAIAVQGITGTVLLQPSSVTERGGRLEGSLRDVALRVFGQPAESLTATFGIDAQKIELPQLTGRLHGGQLRTGTDTDRAIVYLLPGAQAAEGRLSARLAFDNVDLYALLESAGWASPPYSGLASGSVQLDQLDGNQLVEARGRGQLTISRGDLGAVPLFTSIYAQLPVADRPRFHALDTAFELRDRGLRFSRIDVTSNLLSAKGSGSFDLDGYLAIELTLDNLLGPAADPVLMPLIDYLAQNLVTFYLHGYLRDLRAEKRWLVKEPPVRRGNVPLPPLVTRPAPPDF